MLVFKTFGGVDGLELNGCIRFVIWRFIEDLHLGGVVCVHDIAEISNIELLSGMG